MYFMRYAYVLNKDKACVFGCFSAVHLRDFNACMIRLLESSCFYLYSYWMFYEKKDDIGHIKMASR